MATSSGGRYHEGGWLVSITRQARRVSASVTSPSRTTTWRVLCASRGGRG
jgi:hypothetical protein